jgi:hypothetical protein
MPLHKGGEEAVQYNIHELSHHGTRPRSHQQIVAIAEHAAKADDHRHKAAHMHDHVTLHNAHPHAQPSHPHINRNDVDVNPRAKTFHPATGVVAGTHHGQYKHHVHDRRDKGPEHHVPHGLVDHDAEPANNTGNY